MQAIYSYHLVNDAACACILTCFCHFFCCTSLSSRPKLECRGAATLCSYSRGVGSHRRYMANSFHFSCLFVSAFQPGDDFSEAVSCSCPPCYHRFFFLHPKTQPPVLRHTMLLHKRVCSLPFRHPFTIFVPSHLMPPTLVRLDYFVMC
jgi:hypothetical protein